MSERKQAFEVINPPHLIKFKVGRRRGNDPEVVAKAEAAVAELEQDYPAWLDDDFQKLQQAFDDALAEPQRRREHFRRLFHAAHEMRGMGESIGYPLVTRMGRSLCMLIESLDEALDGLGEEDIELVRAHVDALAAVVRDNVSGQGDEIARELAVSLEQTVEKRQA